MTNHWLTMINHQIVRFPLFRQPQSWKLLGFGLGDLMPWIAWLRPIVIASLLSIFVFKDLPADGWVPTVAPVFIEWVWLLIFSCSCFGGHFVITFRLGFGNWKMMCLVRWWYFSRDQRVRSPVARTERSSPMYSIPCWIWTVAPVVTPRLCPKVDAPNLSRFEAGFCQNLCAPSAGHCCPRLGTHRALLQWLDR